MKICFMGTPDFAVPTLEILAAAHQVVGVITQPDKPKGRGKKLAPPPIKETAQSLGIPILQPQKIKAQEVFEWVAALQPDIIIVIAYGQILPKSLLELPKYGAVNIHGSLLPKYRGAAPIQWAIINGEQKTGVTIMQMDVGMDTGHMILKKEMAIDNKTAGEVFEEMAVLGADAIVVALAQIQEGTATFTPQDEKLATYAPMLTKEQGRIDWSKTTDQILSLVNGLNPWPGAYAVLNGQNLKIWRVVANNTKRDAVPGCVLTSSPKQGIIVRTGDGAVALEEIQSKTGKRMPSKEYVKGNPVETNTMLY
ncbi:MAG: methionyl-tRNA formyltransferase [Defluviitaleaceae bacterium]|nr:methionyl-tRNA formyltransferase [Defluviitaleaceae bacterium]